MYDMHHSMHAQLKAGIVRSLLTAAWHAFPDWHADLGKRSQVQGSCIVLRPQVVHCGAGEARSHAFIGVGLNLVLQGVRGHLGLQSGDGVRICCGLSCGFVPGRCCFPAYMNAPIMIPWHAGFQSTD